MPGSHTEHVCSPVHGVMFYEKVFGPCGLFSDREEADLAPSPPSEPLGVGRIQEASTSGGGWVYNDSVRKAIREIPDQAWTTIFAPGLHAAVEQVSGSPISRAIRARCTQGNSG